MSEKLRVGLVGYGKAGKAVANVLSKDPRFDLRWIAHRSNQGVEQTHTDSEVPVIGLDQTPYSDLLEQYPIDALVDFSRPESLHTYGEEIRKRSIMLVSAISAYSESDLEYARSLGKDIRILCSPNITLGINFLLISANLLRKIAPFADVEIVEQHFRDKPEISGTAFRIAETLEVDDDRVTSLRLGGIVGHHEVIFGFPYQTVRLIHDSIRREAFGTGAAFALSHLADCEKGFFTFDDLMLQLMREHLFDPPRSK